MIYELDQADYRRVRPLFPPLEAYQPACTAVLEGIYPGRVWADDPGHPRTALLVTSLGAGAAWCFLVGDPGDDRFNRALNRAIFDREIGGEEVGALLFTCHPEDWQGQLAVVCHPRQPVPMARRHYLCRELAYDWRAHVPGGLALEPIDPALLSRPGLDLPGEVQETLDRWRAAAGPRLQDFGFVAIQGDQVVAWATVDFVAGGAGDIGFFTREPYRRRGLATITAAAALEHGLSSGLSHVSWTCADDNLGSIRIAEKLGCVRERDYQMYVFSFNEAHNLAQLAYGHLLAGRYREVIDTYDRFFALQEQPPAWAYLDVARAWAALGDPDQALALLDTAAERGGVSQQDLESYPELAGLHGTAGWAALLERIRPQGE